MKEYKRLTERAVNGEAVTIGCKTCSDMCCNCEFVDSVINRLTDLEDKIENGTLTELPCKVGDKVYEIFYSKYEERILEMKVIQITIQETINYRCKTTSPCLYNYGWVKNDDFNKTWFLTKAEAEKRLEELKEV